jgi:hypothetical protein
MPRSRSQRRRSPPPRPTRPRHEPRDQKQKAAAKVEGLQTQLDAAKANAKSKLDAAAAAQDAAKASETKKADAAKAASEARLALEPVSVFISRATQKLYVRRNTHKRLPDGGEMFDATIEVPVTIRNPDKPIGTHVFTAVARTDGGLRWTAVTIDSGDVAKAALDRITVPQDVLNRIAPTGWPVLARISPFGCMVGSGSTDMGKMFGGLRPSFFPSTRYAIGTFFTPRFLKIIAAKAAIGPLAGAAEDGTKCLGLFFIRAFVNLGADRPIAFAHRAWSVNRQRHIETIKRHRHCCRSRCGRSPRHPRRAKGINPRPLRRDGDLAVLP